MDAAGATQQGEAAERWAKNHLKGIGGKRSGSPSGGHQAREEGFQA